MFRLDPKQAVLDHVARQSAGAQRPAALSRGRRAHRRSAGRAHLFRRRDRRRRAGHRGAAARHARLRDLSPPMSSRDQAAFYIPVIMGVGARRQRPVQRRAHAPHRRLPHADRADRAACWRPGRWCSRCWRVGVFLFKASDLVSRVWLVSWYVGGARRCSCVFRLSLRALVLAVDRGGPAQAPHGHRRRRHGCRSADRRHPQGRRQRHQAVRPVRRPRSTTARRNRSRACPSWARSPTSSNSRAAPASIWSSSRCRCRRKSACSKCSSSSGCCRSTSGCRRI